MGKIEKILKKGPVEGQTTEVYPVTSTKAVYDENNKRLDNIITRLQESVYLNAPIPISTENTPESMAQNVKNIADYVEKAKAAGIADVNGMAVSCIINNDYSGVGYIYKVGGGVYINGIITYEDASNPFTFAVQGGDGTYSESELVTRSSNNQITSDMLVEGARKPIILTPSTTEVDEETYQKLLSDDVDVVFKDAYDIFYYVYDIDKNVSVNDIQIRFVTTLGSIDTTGPSDYWFSVASVKISKNAPHTVTTESADHSLQDVLESTLSPVLKKINLRKGNNSAVIKQFEADWENLNGSLYGARFIGYPAGVLPVLFMKDDFNDCYIGYTDRNIDGGPDSTGPFKKITLCANDNYNLKVTDVTATVQYIDLNATTTNLTSIGAVQQNTPHCFTYTKDSEIIKGVGQVWQSSSYGYLEGISFDGKYRVHAEVQANGAATVTLTSIGAQKLLQPVLQEIDLTGTDAERKAKLDQFETDWKALTGAGDLTGARFVGKVNVIGDTVGCVFNYDDSANNYIGIAFDSASIVYKINIVALGISKGSVEVTPLFSHLEAITIYTDNTPEHMQANLDNIAAYEANLQALGVDTVGVKAPIIPIYTDDSENHGFIQRNDTGLNDWTGICTAKDWLNQINIDIDSGKATVHRVALYKDVVDKTLNAKSLEAITIKTNNSTASKRENKAAIKAYVDNLTALGVDTTKGYMIPVKLDNGYHGFIMGTGADGEHTGIIKRDTYNYGGGWIFIDNIGTYQYLECLTLGSYDDLTTTAKTIVPAINEVNALAKGYSTIFTPIELTTETAQNKTAIDARVAAFTAQGISLTNGCCIPVTYKGVYAGNISLINGDWYGLLVKNTNNPADNINIKLSADGTITEGNSVQ